MPIILRERSKRRLKARSAAVAVTASSLTNSYQKRLRTWRQKIGCRRYTLGKILSNSGGLMSYGPDRVEPYRRAAVYVDKILKGTKPADFPSSSRRSSSSSSILKTAKQIGLTIPPNVLVRADRGHQMTFSSLDCRF